jgi:hypothetical protein
MRLGADPEVFLEDEAGKPRSAIGYILADKHNPLQIEGMAQGFTLQEDNVALEYGIPPASTAEEFDAHIANVMEKSKEWVKGLKFSKLSCTLFPKEELQHPLAHIFGCEPDFDAWTGKENQKPEPPDPTMRSAGGHVHVETKKDKRDLIKKMDLYLSVPAVRMDQGAERKKLYGKAGAYRPKSYGVEYRSLSNFWIFDQPLRMWVWRQTERALNSKIMIDEYEDFIKIAVNDNDVNMADALINEFHLEVL